MYIYIYLFRGKRRKLSNKSVLIISLLICAACMFFYVFVEWISERSVISIATTFSNIFHIIHIIKQTLVVFPRYLKVLLINFLMKVTYDTYLMSLPECSFHRTVSTCPGRLTCLANCVTV